MHLFSKPSTAPGIIYSTQKKYWSYFGILYRASDSSQCLWRKIAALIEEASSPCFVSACVSAFIHKTSAALASTYRLTQTNAPSIRSDWVALRPADQCLTSGHDELTTTTATTTSSRLSFNQARDAFIGSFSQLHGTSRVHAVARTCFPEHCDRSLTLQQNTCNGGYL